MPKNKILLERKVQNTVLRWLGKQGYSIPVEEAFFGEHGVDIRRKHWRYGRYWLVECKGDPDPQKVKNLGARRESSFRTALGQIVTRMKFIGRNHYSIALPESSRFSLKRVPWNFAKKNQFSILIANNSERVTEYDWKSLREIQKKTSKN